MNDQLEARYVIAYPDQEKTHIAYSVLSSNVRLDNHDDIQYEEGDKQLIICIKSNDYKKFKKMSLSFLESYESFNDTWNEF